MLINRFRLRSAFGLSVASLVASAGIASAQQPAAEASESSVTLEVITSESEEVESSGTSGVRPVSDDVMLMLEKQLEALPAELREKVLKSVQESAEGAANADGQSKKSVLLRRMMVIGPDAETGELQVLEDTGNENGASVTKRVIIVNGEEVESDQFELPAGIPEQIRSRISRMLEEKAKGDNGEGENLPGKKTFHSFKGRAVIVGPDGQTTEIDIDGPADFEAFQMEGLPGISEELLKRLRETPPKRERIEIQSSSNSGAGSLDALNQKLDAIMKRLDAIEKKLDAESANE